MKKFNIQISSHIQDLIELEKLSYNYEINALEALITAFKREDINFKIKQTKDRKVFLNSQQGELASIHAPF